MFIFCGKQVQYFILRLVLLFVPADEKSASPSIRFRNIGLCNLDYTLNPYASIDNCILVLEITFKLA
jgi:hypothetical protein